jgi:hypothetical protein
MGSLLLGYADIFAPVLIIVVACAIISAALLARIKRGVAGFLLGLLLGPIGLIIAWVMRSNRLRQEEAQERVARFAELPDIGALGGSGRPMSEELDELIRQRARGEISQDEYERRKDRIIG